MKNNHNHTLSFARASRGSVFASLVFLFTSGCGSTSSGDAVECVSDAECAAVASARCGAKGVCEAVCVSSSECGNEEVCAAGACVALRSPTTPTTDGKTEPGDCFAILDGTQTVDPEKLSEVASSIGTDPIVVGVMGDFIDGDGHYFVDALSADGVAMALNEINSQTFLGGRKMVALMCSQRHPEAAAAHLVAVGVKAVVGPTIERVSREIAPTLAAAKIPMISSWLEGASAGATADLNGLLWLPTPSREATMTPLQAKLSLLESAFLAENASNPRKMKVAVLIDDASIDGEYARYRELIASLVFNGALATTNETDTGCTAGSAVGCLRVISSAVDATDSAGGAKSTAAIAEEIRAYAPDVIIPIGDVTMISALPPIVEKVSYAESSAKPRWLVPFNLFEFGVFKNIDTYTNTVDPKLPPSAIPDSALARVSGIRVFRGNDAYDQMVSSLNSFAGERAIDAEDARPVARSYEDMSLVFYASMKAMIDATSAGRNDFSAKEVAMAIPKVTDATAATSVDASLSDFLDQVGTNALLAGRSIRLRGVLSAFDFDPITGRVPGRWEAWQVNATGTVQLGADYTFTTYSYGGSDPSGECFSPVDKSFSPATCATLRSQ